MSNAIYFLRLPQVMERTGLSRTALLKLVATGDFPQPVKIGLRVKAWSSEEVTEWQRAIIAERNNGATR